MFGSDLILLPGHQVSAFLEVLLEITTTNSKLNTKYKRPSMPIRVLLLHTFLAVLVVPFKDWLLQLLRYVAHPMLPYLRIDKRSCSWMHCDRGTPLSCTRRHASLSQREEEGLEQEHGAADSSLFSRHEKPSQTYWPQTYKDA